MVDTVLDCFILHLSWLCCHVLIVHSAWPVSVHLAEGGCFALHLQWALLLRLSLSAIIFSRLYSYVSLDIHSIYSYLAVLSASEFAENVHLCLPWSALRLHLSPVSVLCLAWFSVHYASREQESWSELCLCLVHSDWPCTLSVSECNQPNTHSPASSVLSCVHSSSDTAVIHFQWEFEIYSNSRYSAVQ